MATSMVSSKFLMYLAANGNGEGESSQLPSLLELSKTLGVSVSQLREQMEVARALGLVDVRPKTGMRKLPYTFAPAVKQSLAYAIALDRSYFEPFSDLRRHIEATYWHQAVQLLNSEDLAELQALVDSAWGKLRGEPVQIPHEEHRELHLSIYRRLKNPFVLGILEAYWDAYETVGLNVYADYHYLVEVWNYHQKMVEAIRTGDYDRGYRALIDHNELIYHRAATGMERVGSHEPEAKINLSGTAIKERNSA